MKIIFRGVRGSFPASAPHCLRYGGNTPCIEVETGDGALIIDAGTGICALGKSLAKRQVRDIHLLLSHTHWDHIQGFPHFAPLYQKGTRIHIYSLHRTDRSLRDIFRAQQEAPFFPVPLDQAGAELVFTELEDGATFSIGRMNVLCHRLNHPGIAGGFRLEQGGHALAYVCDTDLQAHILLGDGMDEDGSDAGQAVWRTRLQKGAHDLARGADLMVCDTFFLPDEYKPDWGHSCPDDALRLGREAGARRVALFHHEPHRSDAELDSIVERYRRESEGKLELLAAAEGLELEL